MTKEQIAAEVRNAWVALGANGGPDWQSGLVVNEVQIGKDHSSYSFKAHSMYEPPVFNAQVLMRMVEIFETEHIDETSFSIEGCETCDYGSQYGFHFLVRARKDGES